MASDFALSGRLGINVRELLKGLDQAKTAAKDTAGEVKDLEDRVDDLDAATADPEIAVDPSPAEQALDRLDKAIAALDGERADPEVDVDSSQAVGAIEDVSGRMARVDGERAEPEVDADTSKADTELREIKGRLDDLDSTRVEPEVDVESGEDAGEGFGGSFIAGFAGAGVGAAIVGIVNEGFDRVHMDAKFRQQFGYVGDEAEHWGKVAGDAWGNGWGDSLGEVNYAVGLVEQRLVRTGEISQESAETAVTSYLAMSDVFDKEVTESIEAVASVLLNDLVDSSDEATDIIIAGMQDGADSAGDLFESIDEYAQHYSALGLTLEDMMAMFVHGMQNGQRDTDKLADAVLEFRLRAVADTEAVGEAYAAAGLDADEYRQKVAAGGPAARQAFLDVLHGLQSIEDPQHRELMAVELLGTQYEDLGPTGLDSLLAIEGGTRDVSNATEDLVGDMDEATSEMTILWRRVTGTLADVGETAATVINDALSFDNSDFEAGLGRIRERLDETRAAIEAYDGPAEGFEQHMLDLGFAGDEVAAALLAGEHATDDLTGSVVAAAPEVDTLSAAVDQSARRLDELERSTSEADAAAGPLIDTSDRLKDALLREAEGAGTLDRQLQNVIGTQRAMVDPTYAAMQAQERLDDALARLSEEGGNTIENMRDVTTAQIDLDAANATLAASTDNVASEIMELGLRSGLTEEQAWALGAAVNDTREKAEDFAGEYKAEVVADTAQANADIDYAARDRTATIRINQEGRVTLPGGAQVYDAGGQIGAGEFGIVAERRPEFVNGVLVSQPSLIQGPASVTGGAATAAMLGGRGAAGAGTATGAVGSVSTPNVAVQVFVGDRELTDIVDVRVRQHDERGQMMLAGGVNR